MVEVMQEREDVDPNKAGEDGLAPLLLAACDGQEVVVDLLIGWGDVDPDEPGLFGHTPLSRAAFSGPEGVVK